MRLVNWRALVVGAAGFGLAACGDDVTVTQPPLSYTVSPSSGAVCTTGGSTAVGVTVTGGSGTPTVNFSAQNSLITVAGTGTSATVTCGATAGGSAVNFTITSGGQTVTGSIPVTINAGTNNNSPVTAIQVNPSSASLVPGGTTTLTATVTLAQGAPANTSTAATFTSGDPTIATVTTNANGTATVTALNTPANVGKQVVITATSVANTNLKAFSTITIAATSTIIQSLQVSPSAVSLSTGGTQQITANVTLAPGAPAGTSTGVTYVSSDTSIAKVSTSGLITAGSRAGVATITVASAAAPTVAQQVAVTVSSLAPVRLTIQSLQVVNGAGNLVPADPTNVAGNLFATLNLDPGSFTPDSVVAMLGTQRVVCQRFTAQLAQLLRASVTDGSADFAPIQCPINTSLFNTTTGAPSVLNGQQTLSAQVFYRPSAGSPASTTQTATIPVQLTLNNQSGFFVSATNTPTAAQVANGGPANGQAVGPQGVTWRAGSLTVTALPVFFTTTSGQTGTQTITIGLADAVSGQFATKTGSAAAGAPVSVTFDGTSAAFTPAPANNTLDGYTSPNAGQPTGGTQIVIGGGANTVFLNNNGVPQAAGPVIYVDNAFPEPRAQFVSTNFLIAGGPAGFINGSFVFADSVQQAAAATTLADNNGVDRVSRAFFFAANTGQTAAQIVSGGTAVTNGGQINQNISQTAFAAAAKLTDALGNAVPVGVSALNGGPLFTFGVITATPVLSTVTAGTNIGSNARIGASVTTARTIAFQATSTSGASFPTNYVVGTLQVVAPAGTFCAT
ncbi:MAG: Ig-like domain-containing protein, partial [Gemmatirosa sp.]|nr:Ig-like domain-containing protein [Gemmatirosa sp.]